MARRPWLVYGEGAIKAKGGHFGEDFAYTAKDNPVHSPRAARSTRWRWAGPKTAKLVVRSLATTEGAASGRIKQVSLLGHRGKLEWSRTPKAWSSNCPPRGLPSLPARSKSWAATSSRPPSLCKTTTIQPDNKGNYTLLAETADVHGDGIKPRSGVASSTLASGTTRPDFVTWQVNFTKPGKFK